MITFKQWRSWPRYEQNGVGQQQQNHQQAPWYQCHNYQFTSELSNNSSSNSNNNSNSNTINKKKKMPSSVKNGDTGVLQPGWIDVWRLWRHCLCRFGWYPLFVAPLVTVACLLDLYSSTGCDFIRMDIGFRPANDVWSDSHAQLGLFSFDGNEMDRNKWKRAFNNGCRPYTDNFVNVFIEQDQTWHISRIMAYISGIASLVALATAWLLTITPLPASFFWPGVLLPAVVLAMLSGAAKFFFFSAQICSEPFWFMDETSSEAVAAESCEIGESSVFGIASVAAYFFCTILICFRSPQKRILDENFGRRSPHDHGSTISHRTQNTPSDIICNHQSDPEQGHAHASDGVNHHHYKSSSGNNNNNNNNLDSGMERRESMLDSQRTTKHKNNNTTPKVIQHGPQHTRNTSDVTWSTGSNKNVQHNALQERSRNLGVLSPATKEETEEEVARAEEYSYGRPIVVTINDNSGGGNSSNMSKQSMSYSDGSTTQSSSKSHGPSRGSSGGGSSLPPRHNGKSTVTSANPTSLTHGNSRHESDSGSIQSRISKLSLADTQVSDEMSALGMNSYAGSSSHKSAPSVVAIPTHRRSSNHNMTAFATGVTASPGGTTATTTSSASSSSATTSSASVGKQKKKKLRYAKNRSHCAREDSRNDHVNFSNEHGTSSLGRDEYGGLLPPLDEMSASAGAPPSHTITRSFDMIDHGDLINKCVRDLENSFADGADDNKNRFRTM